MGLADLHVHSIHSYDGTVAIPAILQHVANHTKLNVIALTVHMRISLQSARLFLWRTLGTVTPTN